MKDILHALIIIIVVSVIGHYLFNRNTNFWETMNSSIVIAATILTIATLAVKGISRLSEEKPKEKPK